MNEYQKLQNFYNIKKKAFLYKRNKRKFFVSKFWSKLFFNLFVFKVLPLQKCGSNCMVPGNKNKFTFGIK